MFHLDQRSAGVVIATAVLWLAGTHAAAQTTTCTTSNCTFGKDAGGNPILPAACQNYAAPRTIEVQMNSPNVFTHQFVPSGVRVEGQGASGGPWAYQCIRWRKTGSTTVPWHSSTEDTAGNSCRTGDSPECSVANVTPPCDWETGNIDSGGATTLDVSVCHYANVPVATYSFQCRLHVGFGMAGSLTVVNEIQLNVRKNGAGDAILEWPTGGVGPWTVHKDSAPAMTGATTPLVNTLARTHTDPASATDAYYLVMEQN